MIITLDEGPLVRSMRPHFADSPGEEERGAREDPLERGES
jgi:hypothetical protein